MDFLEILLAKEGNRFLKIPEFRQEEFGKDHWFILAEWMIEVKDEYRLESQTLAISMELMKKLLFIENFEIKKQTLQLIGITCLWIASKFEEVYSFSVGDATYITNNTYTEKQIMDMEKVILTTLQFEMTFPTVKMFLDLHFPCSKKHKVQKRKCWYSMELVFLDYELFIEIPSSFIAQSIFHVATKGKKSKVFKTRPIPGYILQKVKLALVRGRSKSIDEIWKTTIL
jgi:hypothetical protein